MNLHPKETVYPVELQGRLALLMGTPEIYPQMRIAASGGTMVAGERFGHYSVVFWVEMGSK